MPKRKLSDITANQVVNTTTPDEDRRFRELLDREGFRWRNGDSYTSDAKSNGWLFKENQCYCVKAGTQDKLGWFFNMGYEILPASDFLDPEPLFKDAKPLGGKMAEVLNDTIREQISDSPTRLDAPRFNEELCQQVREGRLAIRNDGTLQELREVLKYIFPKDRSGLTGHCPYYAVYRINSSKWVGIDEDELNIPTKSVRDFYLPSEPAEPDYRQLLQQMVELGEKAKTILEQVK